MRVSVLTTLVVITLGFSMAQAFFDFDALNCLTRRTYDGRCNNLIRPNLGAANTYLIRGAEGVKYADGIREPILTPNPRTVSNELFRADESYASPLGHNLLWTFFGQFVTHDMLGVHRVGDLNISEIRELFNASLSILIPLEQSDDAFFLMNPPIENNFTRVLRSRGDFVNGRFEVGSDSTAYLDLDIVYGKDEEVAHKLRAFSNGLMLTRYYMNYTAYNGTAVPPTQVSKFGEWLPLVEDVDPNREVIPISNQLVGVNIVNVPQRFFATGDGRNGENYALNIFHGMFVREHNRLARELKLKYPFWNDEKLFQAARKINIAQYQAVVMYEYLPSILRSESNLVGNYDGYKWTVDPSGSQLFAFAMRFGHTTVPDSYYLKNQCNQRPFGSSRDGPRSGQQSGPFMPADQIAQVEKPENIIHALLFEKSRRVDVQFPESLRSIRGAFSDIIVQNQIRAAEHGIPDYHTIRKLWYGGPQANLYNRPGCKTASESSPAPDPIQCFRYMTANETVAQGLRNLYGKINNINFYVAVVAEDPEQSAVGRTSARIIADQFRRVRDGDRWWFESEWAGFTRREIRDLKNTKMQHLLQRNFPEVHAQKDAFYVPKPSHFANC